MPSRSRTVSIPLSEIQVDESRIYEPFMEAYLAYLSGETIAEERTVAAREVSIPEGYEAPAEHVDLMLESFTWRRRTREEAMEAIAVLERADGSLWAYDDAALIAAYHLMAPNARLRCHVIGKDSR